MWYWHYLDSINKLHSNAIPYGFSLQSVALRKGTVVVSVQNQNQRNISHECRAHSHGIGCQSNSLIEFAIRNKCFSREVRSARCEHVLAGAADTVAG